MEEIIVLEIKFKFRDVEDTIYPVILKDDANMVLVDCGYVGFLAAIEEAMKENHLNYAELTHILVTHQDHDHMGALCALKQKYPRIQILASEKEAPYISGKSKSLRLEQAEALQPLLPEGQKAFGEEFCNLLRSVEPAEVDLMVQDGDTFDWCGGCEIVGTPGHTPGHISIYVRNKKTFISGDAAALENGNLVIANPHFTIDMDKAEKSLNKILNFNAEEIICYHGGILKCNSIINQQK